jgi:hypothetical protein
MVPSNEPVVALTGSYNRWAAKVPGRPRESTCATRDRRVTIEIIGPTCASPVKSAVSVSPFAAVIQPSPA